MNITYVTTKNFAAATADHIYILQLSQALATLLGANFCLVCSSKPNENLDVNISSVDQKFKSHTLNLFFFLLQHIFFSKKSTKNDWYITNDFYIALVLIFYKKILRQKIWLCFDAHMLTDTWKDGFVLTKMDKIVTTSEVLRNRIDLMIDGVTETVTIWGGVDTQLYTTVSESTIEATRTELGLSKSKVLGYVGNFTSLGQKKNLEVMLLALKFLPEKYTVLLVGATDQELLEYKLLAKEHELTKRVLVLKKVTYTEVHLYQFVCDYLVIPYPDSSHFTDQGFPMKAFEYLSTGKPVLFSNFKIMKDFLDLYGFSFNPNEPANLAAVVLESQRTRKPSVELESISWNTKAQKIVDFLSTSKS